MMLFRIVLFYFLLAAPAEVETTREVQLPRITLSFSCPNLLSTTITTTEQGTLKFNHVRELTGFYNDFFPSSLDVIIADGGSSSHISYSGSQSQNDATTTNEDSMKSLTIATVTISSSGGTMLLSEATLSSFKNTPSHEKTIHDFVTPQRLSRYFHSVCIDGFVHWKAEVTSVRTGLQESSTGCASTSTAASTHSESSDGSMPLPALVVGMLTILFVVLLVASRLHLGKTGWMSMNKPIDAPSPTEEPETNHKDSEDTIDANKAEFWHTVFNLANMLMGIGLVGLPYAFARAGLLGGLLLLLLTFLVTWQTAILIGRLLNGDPRPSSYFVGDKYSSISSSSRNLQQGFRERENEASSPGHDSQGDRMIDPVDSYQDLARISFGRIGGVAFSALLYADLFSAVCVFFVMIGDHLHTLIPSTTMKAHVLIVGAFATVTATIFQTARQISYLSMLGTFATIYVVGAVLVAFFMEGNLTEEVAAQQDPPPPPPYHSPWHSNGLVEAFGIIMFCFGGQAQVPFIYHSMQKPHEYEDALSMAYKIVIGTCLSVGLCGYFMFGELVLDQVTLSLQLYSSFALAQEFLLCLMIATAFSKLILANFPLVLFLEDIFIAPSHASNAPRGFDSSKTSRAIQQFFFTVVARAIIFTLAAVVAICVPSFSSLSSRVGTILITIPTIVFPALAYVKLFGASLGMGQRLLYCSIAIGGTTIAVVGTVLTFLPESEGSGQRFRAHATSCCV